MITETAHHVHAASILLYRIATLRTVLNLHGCDSILSYVYTWTARRKNKKSIVTVKIISPQP